MALVRVEEVGDEVNEKIYVAVSKNQKACMSSLEWAVRNLKGKRLCLVHVHQPAKFMSILGGRFPISSLSEQEVMAHQEQERQDMCKILDEYLRICTKAKVQVEKLYIEMETVESGLVELISRHKIERLVMGAAANKSYSRKMVKPKSKKANYVRQHAPAFCHIWFICMGHLIYTREGIKKSCLNDEDLKRHQADSKSRWSQFTGKLSNSFSIVESEGSFDRSSTFSLSQLSVFSRPSEAATNSTSYHSATEDIELSFRSFVLSPLPEGNQLDSYSPKVLEEDMEDALYDQLDQAIAEAETAKEEAYIESIRRCRAEKDAIEASGKANAAENMYYEELRRRKELEEELAKTTEKLESTNKVHDMALDKLRNILDQNLLLKNRTEKSDVIGEELEENLISALELLQSIKKLIVGVIFFFFFFFFLGKLLKNPEMGSSKDLLGETRKGMVIDDKVFVAVSKELKESKITLQWALQNSNGEKNICIIYVHVPANVIPMPMGGKFPASQVGEKELKAFREQENKEMNKILDDYLQICAKVGAHAEKLHIERDSIEEGIVEIISQQKIGRLVMGAAADRRYSRKMVEPKSKKANYVRQHAPDFCHIRFICKGRLICTREGVKQPSLDVEGRSSKSLENVQIDAGILSQKLHSSLRISNDDGSEGSSDRYIQTLRPCFSESSIRLPGPKSAFSSPCSSFSREGAPESSLELLVLPQTKIERQRSSPPSVLQESSMNDDLYDQLVQAMEEADNSKREAFEESMRRRKAEKEAINAIRKAKSAESLYFEEFRQRKEQEEELHKRKKELEFTKSQLEKVLQELQVASDQRLSLENQYEKSKLIEKEMDEKVFSAVGLLQKYKAERDELQVERDHALREAEILRKQLDQEPSSSHVPFFFSEFSFSDLEKATNNFDPSLKIGEGGYGSIYKGFLRQSQVAIKILNPNSMQGPQEFEQEVDVLSKLRHPNLVTLIGACHESWALVYEYLSGGSLEDRLICKNNTPPLPWQTRIQIATDLCVVLIFLHSSRPTSIIHGDIKPSNILLDENFVCKLSDFGICCVISHRETSMEQTTRFCTSQPKGTFSYMDPEFLTTGELTPKCDIYSFGIILLRLLTGRPAMGITKEVEYALNNGNLNCLLDPSAGDWPFVQAEQLARMALRCCEMNGRNRPDLESDVWRVLEPMKASSRSLSMPWLASDDRAPHYFICPIFQEIMEDPQIASDGFTYEAEAIRGWLDSGHDTSPMTNAKLAKHDFIPNHALRSAIQEWIQNRRCVLTLSVSTGV
ncbi:U-box domain-containing protein 33-like [Chenopodium quinoa]|nr:U-box domain-containing protein 33-like [Chenopodium quinoa]